MNAVGHTPALASRLPQVSLTIFSVMSALAQQHGAVTSDRAFRISAAMRGCSTQ